MPLCGTYTHPSECLSMAGSYLESLLYWRFTSSPSDDQLLSNWYPKNVKHKMCRRNTSYLIEQMQNTQRQLSSHIQEHFTSLDKRFKVMNPLFDTAMAGFRYILQPFELMNKDEAKYFLEFSDPQASCNYITLGVGHDWEAEKKMQKKYPQCQFLGVDPIKENRKLVEAEPNSRFVLAALSDTVGNKSALVYDKDYENRNFNHRAFIEFLATENKGELVDFMTMDIEGPEFLLLKEMHHKRPELPIICQLNAEVHYNHHMVRFPWEQISNTFKLFFEESRYVLLKTNERFEEDRIFSRMFFVNVVDEEFNSGRFEYVEELSKHINITKIGSCYGNRKSSEELKKLLDDHYFVLAFENSICPEYTTEKYWRFSDLVVPVLMSRGILNWHNVINGTFIVASDFESPSTLAEHLNSLIDDKSAYMDGPRAIEKLCWAIATSLTFYRLINLNAAFSRLSQTTKSNQCSEVPLPILPPEMFGEAVKFEMKFANFNLTYEMKQPKSSFLVLVISRPDGFYAREMIRRTWMNDINKPSDYRVLFIVGHSGDPAINRLLDEEQRQFGDVIRYSAEDTYERLYVKVHAAFSWQQKFCPQARYLLKTDDDTAVDLGRMNYFVQTEFNPLLKEHPKAFICNRWAGKRPLRDPHNPYVSTSEYNGTVYPTFCQGCSYLTTTDAIGTLLNNTINVKTIHLEDVLFTGLVAEKSPEIYHHSSAAFGEKKITSCDNNKVPYMCTYIGITPWKLGLEYRELKNLKCK
ncbi:Hexosyltransferase [Aphelenchoides besseyi]|nr:Hexosyltransferase [Aphelenchoides besseyi]